MRQIFNNIILLFLVIMIVAPLSVSFFSYKIQLKKIKKEVKMTLINNTPKNDLVFFEFDMKSLEFQNLYWHHSREFEMDLKMFDIVEADTIGDIVQYLCFPDKQETELNAAFKSQLEDRYASDKPIKNRTTLMASLMMSLYFQDYIEKPKVIATFTKQKKYFIESKYTSISLEIDSPPPQFFS